MERMVKRYRRKKRKREREREKNNEGGIKERESDRERRNARMIGEVAIEVKVLDE